MSVLAFDDGDLFIFRVIKGLSTNPENKWVNSYEFQADETGTPGVLVGLATALVSYEAALHATSVVFDRVIVSTWEADSKPYDPASFMSIPLTQTGVRPITSEEVEPLGMAWRVNRQCNSGRFGNLFYRGALFENQVLSPAGIPVLENAAEMEGILGDALDDSTLIGYMGSSPTEGLHLVMINAVGEQVRPVISLVSSGVSLIKQDHMWFNRTPAEPSIMAKVKSK